MGWSDRRATALAFRGKGAPSQLEAIGPLAVAAVPLWLPLTPGQDANSNRRLRLFAAGDQGPGTVKVTFHDNSGPVGLPQTLTFALNGTADVPLSAGSGYSTATWAGIESSTAVAARMETSSNSDSWSIEARPAPQPGSLIQPHVEWNGLFTTRLLVLNTSSSPQNVTITLHARDGSSPVPPVTRTIQAGSVLNDRIEDIFGIAPAAQVGAGWFEAQTNGPGILVTALAFDPRSGAAAASAMSGGAAGSFSMPFFVQGNGYWTGLALANSGGSAASITITAYDPSGTLLATVSPPALAPKQSLTQLVSQWMPGLAEEATGQILITSSAPLSLLAYFGTGDGASLAAIPFTPIAP